MLDPGERMTDRKERLMKESVRGAKFTSSKGSAKYKGARNPGNNSRDSEISLYEYSTQTFFPDKEPRLEEFNLKVEMARTQLENRLKQTKNKQNLIVFTKDQSHEKAASVEATCDHEGPKNFSN